MTRSVCVWGGGRVKRKNGVDHVDWSLIHGVGRNAGVKVFIMGSKLLYKRNYCPIIKVL